MQSCIQAGYKSIKCPLGILGGFPGGSAGKELPCNSRDLSSVPGLGRCPGEGNSYPLQYSGLENSTDCIVHGVSKSWTRLSNFHFTSFHFALLDAHSLSLERVSLQINPLLTYHFVSHWILSVMRHQEPELHKVLRAGVWSQLKDCAWSPSLGLGCVQVLLCGLKSQMWVVRLYFHTIYVYKPSPFIL